MLLLDTHSFIWLVSDQEKLGAKAVAHIKRENQSAGISIVTTWEIALLHKRDRLKLPMLPETYVDLAIQHHGLIEFPLTRDIVHHAVQLPDIHNDPFDRILIATAQVNGMKLISKDSIFARYPDIDLIW